MMRSLPIMLALFFFSGASSAQESASSIPQDPQGYSGKKSAVLFPSGRIRGKVAFEGGFGGIGGEDSSDNVWFYGAGFGAELGLEQKDEYAIFAGVHYTRSRTPEGLSIQYGDFGLTGEAVFGLFRFGLGPHISYFALNRISNDQALDAFLFGIHLTASVDIIHTNSFNLYFAIRPLGDYRNKNAAIIHIGAGLGARF